jgi:hypothetical protein
MKKLRSQSTKKPTRGRYRPNNVDLARWTYPQKFVDYISMAKFTYQLTHHAKHFKQASSNNTFAVTNNKNIQTSKSTLKSSGNYYLTANDHSIWLNKYIFIIHGNSNQSANFQSPKLPQCALHHLWLIITITISEVINVHGLYNKRYYSDHGHIILSNERATANVHARL